MLKSKTDFAVPQHPNRYEMKAQVRRYSGTYAVLGLISAILMLLAFNVWHALDDRPVHGTAECKAKQLDYRMWEIGRGLPHSFEAEVAQCRSA